MTITSKVHGVDMTRRIEVYEAVRRSAWEAYEAVQRPAYEAYEAARRSAWEAYRAAQRPAWEAYRAAQRPAWEALACGDPLVDWIVMNCAARGREALTILRALPADLDTLDAIAAAEGWCEAWEALRDEAIRAGVISR